VGASRPLQAWFSSGHRRATAAAVALLPPDGAGFLRADVGGVVTAAAEPDLWKSGLEPTLTGGEAAEHYQHAERLVGVELPKLRSGYEALLAARGLAARHEGYLLYAILEGTERLSLCFAEVRVRPGDAATEARCRFYAGWLAHYAEDLEQPLHTTMHHDGWALPDGSSPASGIHLKVDALFDLSDLASAPAPAVPGEPAPYADLRAAVLAEFAASHALVDRVYALETALRAGGGDPGLAAFACERYRATTLFVARLFATAWERSATLELPSWFGE